MAPKVCPSHGLREHPGYAFEDQLHSTPDIRVHNQTSYCARAFVSQDKSDLPWFPRKAQRVLPSRHVVTHVSSGASKLW